MWFATALLNSFHSVILFPLPDMPELNCSIFVCLLMQLVMLLWSYFSVVFTDPGGVPPNWRPDVDEERGETAPLSTTELSDTGSPRIRYCRKCNQLKPPRCHHCSVCKFSPRTLNLVIDSGVFGSRPNIATS